MADAMDDSSSVPYVFITLLGTGMPWSEQEVGLSFHEWARKFLLAEPKKEKKLSAIM